MINEQAYHNLKPQIDRDYPYGWYVGIVGGEIAGSAGTFEEVLSILESVEQDPARRLVVQAGAEYPEVHLLRKGMSQKETSIDRHSAADKSLQRQPPVPWVTVRFRRRNRARYIERELAVDTGDPAEAHISTEDWRQIMFATAPSVNTNFGPAAGGWAYIDMPESGIQSFVLVYFCDPLLDVVRRIASSFVGQVGIESLRRLQYGGNDQEFWVRSLICERQQ